MQKLKQLSEGEYSLGNIPVIPQLVYGPVLYIYRFIVEEELPIEELVFQIKRETGVDLEKLANSYNSGGITITEKNDKKTRNEFVCFFNSIPKSLN